MYGSQEGDGMQTLTATEQIMITSEQIAEFIGERRLPENACIRSIIG